MSSKQGEKKKIKPNQNPTSYSALEEKLIVDACLIKSSLFTWSHVLLSITCTSHRRLFPCWQQKDLEGWGGVGWSPHRLNVKRCACLQSGHSPSHPCLVRSLCTLVPCKLPPSAQARSVPPLWWQHGQPSLPNSLHQAIQLVCWWASTV